MELREQEKSFRKKRWFLDGQIFYPWERRFDRLVTPFEEFIHKQTTSGIILMVGSMLALLLANSPLGKGYENIIHTSISFTVNGLSLERSLVHWINEGLMVFFFFVVGLEIKREIRVGELSAPRQATLPIIAAVGGMVFPALIYHMLNPSGECARGWTDSGEIRTERRPAIKKPKRRYGRDDRRGRVIGLGQPLKRVRNADGRVLRDRVVVRGVIPVAPVVGALQRRPDRLAPQAVSVRRNVRIRDAAGGEPSLQRRSRKLALPTSERD